ncbi:MAG: hypothetical protein LIO67_04245 [Lachnospiraceae bacterium]|nr:hypothetical protein [Lachnospiraceae bacterium]
MRRIHGIKRQKYILAAMLVMGTLLVGGVKSALSVRAEALSEEDSSLSEETQPDSEAPELSVEISPAYTVVDHVGYYSSAFTVKFTVRDNLPLCADKLTPGVSVSAGTASVSFGTPVISDSPDDSGCYTYEVEANVEAVAACENEYSFSICGTDAAGNPLVCKNTDISAENYMHDESTQTQGVFTSYPKILDVTAPTGVITCSSAETAYVYGAEDENSGTAGAVYYKGDVEVQISISDNNALDDERLFWALNGGAASHVSGGEASCDISEEGTYGLLVYGTDRAGNALKLTEMISDQSGSVSVQSGSASGSYRESCESGDSYTEPQYKIIIDRTAPVFCLNITAKDGTAYPDLLAGQDRYFFNKGYTATVNLTETNFDQDRLEICYGCDTDGNYEAVTIDSCNKVLTANGFAPSYVCTHPVESDGVYRYRVEGCDKAGNALRYDPDADHDEMEAMPESTGLPFLSRHIVVDTLAPTGVLSVGDYYKIRIESATVELSEPYRQETSAVVKITTDDHSPVQIDYTICSTTDEESVGHADYAYLQTVSATVEGEQIFTVQDVVVTDRAGNMSALDTTNSIYLDVTAPMTDTLAPMISVTAEAEDSHNTVEGTPLFSGDVPLRIVVTDPYGGTKSAGLGLVTWQLYINGVESASDEKTLNEASATRWTANYDDPALSFRMDRTIIVDADSHNYNDIKVVVTAFDNAGNSSTRTYAFGIDVTAPTIEIFYDNNAVENERYFKAPRTATIVVTERNFDTERIRISTESVSFDGWDYQAGSSANGDDDTWTAKIMYQTDGEYTLSVSGEDLLGNEAELRYEGAAPHAFTIDMTAPTVALSFDNDAVVNGKYYKAGRTATLRVTDVNFAGSSDIAVIAFDGVTAPAFSFDGSDTATASFHADGVYSFSGTVTDLAGNVSLPVSCEEFVIDQTAPKIIFHAVEDQKAYGKGEVEEENPGDVFAPYITIEDVNYNADEVSVTLTRAKWDVTDEELTGFGTLRGRTWYLDEIEETVDNDAVYTLTVQVRDLAGNENDAAEGSVCFSLNRFGSVYVLGEETQELIEEYYTNDVPTLTLSEYNLSSANESWINVTRDSEDSARLVEGEDYTATLTGDMDHDCNWKKIEYEVFCSNFIEDGSYRVLFYTEDVKANATTNESQGYSEYAAAIEFCKDTKRPGLILTGVTEGERCNASAVPMLVSYYDNNEMERLVVRVVERDKADTVLGEASYEVANGTLEPLSGEISDYVLKEHDRWQRMTVTAYDSAGNISQESVTFLLTTNRWIRFYNNKPLFYGSICGAGFLCLFSAFLILWRYRRKGEGDIEN